MSVLIILSLILSLVDKITSECRVPKIEGWIEEDNNYYNDSLISNEILKNGVNINYNCNGLMVKSTCLNNLWTPKINLTECNKEKCFLTGIYPNIKFLGADIGHEFKQFDTVSYICILEDEATLLTYRKEGISICEKGVFKPTIRCFNKSSMCKIPEITNSLKNDKYLYQDYIQNNTLFYYYCEKTYSPTYTNQNMYSKLGVSLCLNGTFETSKYPECLHMCHFSSLEHIKKPTIYDFMFVPSGSVSKYFCNDDYPISLADIENENYIKTGWGEISCFNGTFEHMQVCFDGCLIDKKKKVKNNKHLLKNEQSSYYMCDDKKIYILCIKNFLIFSQECQQKNPNISCGCDLKNSENEYFGLTERKLKIGYTTFYKCPEDQFTDGSISDIISNVGKVSCLDTETKCIEGCVLSPNVLHSKMLFRIGEVFDYNCPPDMEVISKNVECLGPFFSKQIACRIIIACSTILLNTTRISNNNIAQPGDIVNLKCGEQSLNFTCIFKDLWDPEILHECYKRCFITEEINNSLIGNWLIKDFYVGEFYSYQCKNEYFSESHGLNFGISFCNFSGNFYPQFGCKLKSNSCVKPFIENTLTTNKNGYKVILENTGRFFYQCIPGYTSNFNELTCIEGIIYDNDICKQKCRILKNQFVANFEKTLVEYNTLTRYNCNRRLFSLVDYRFHTVPNDPINMGVLYCLDGGMFETEEKQLCNFTCTFPENVKTSPETVYNFQTFNYVCDLSGIQENNIRCPGLFLPYCQIDLCVVPEIDNALNYFVVLNDVFKFKIHPFASVANSTTLKINCGTFSLKTICMDGYWRHHFSLSCPKGCKVVKIEGIHILNPPEGTKIKNGQLVNYTCSNNADNEELFASLTCENQKLVGNYRTICNIECEKLNSQLYTLINHNNLKFLPGIELRYNCTGKDLFGEFEYRCTEDGPKMVGKCSNECEITDYIFGIKSITQTKIAENSIFEFQCVQGMAPLAINYFCIKNGNYVKIFPEIVCKKIH